MLRKFGLLLFLIFSLSFVLALDCQYSHDEKIFTDYNKVLVKSTGEYVDVPIIESTNFSVGGSNYNSASFDLFNNYSFEVKLRLIFKYGTKQSIFCNGGWSLYDEVLTLKPFDTKTISYSSAANFCNVQFDSDSLKIIQMESDDISAPLKKTYESTIQVCDKCASNKDCLNDGASCTLASECGGKYCVANHCSTNEFCFENNCQCNSNQIQCTDNKRCVDKNIVQVDIAPSCGLKEECVTGFIKNGVCSETDETLNNRFFDFIKQIGLFLVITIILVLVFLFIKGKNEKDILVAKERKINAEQKLIEARVRERKFELETLGAQIEVLKQKRITKEKEIEKLNSLQNKFNLEKSKLTQYIRNQWDRVNAPFPYELVGNNLVIINPYLGGYLCFYDANLLLENYPTSKLVHRWIWKKANGRWPRAGHHIHHIDGNKYNNDSSNLEEIDGEEHFNKHRQNNL